MPFWSLFDRPYFPREFTSNKNNCQKKLLIIAIIIYNWPHKHINAIIQFLKKEARHDKILHKRNRRQKGTINISGWAVRSTHRSYWCLLNAIINMSGGKNSKKLVFFATAYIDDCIEETLIWAAPLKKMKNKKIVWLG